MPIGSGLSRITLIIFFTFGASFASAEPDVSEPIIRAGDDSPRIVLIIDDLGHWRSAGVRVVSLPGPVACAVLPHTPFGSLIAERAYDAGKEVILHLPLAPIQNEAVAVGTIYMDSTRAQLVRIFTLNIDSIPHVVGVNNHMGSLLTQHPGHMGWLMTEIRERGELFFVDSVTSESSIAMKIAAENGIPVTRRDIFSR